MTGTDSKIAALIGSRICHDLISPIGAINNGIELMGMTGVAQSPEMDLISESVGNASARIRFFRIAFGSASEQQIGAAEADGVLTGALGSGRLAVNWGPQTPEARTNVRLAFLAALCVETALPYGGQIDVLREHGGWLIQGAADKLNVDTALWSLLADPNSVVDLAPAQVQFALLPMLAQEDDRRLKTEIGSDKVTIRF